MALLLALALLIAVSLKAIYAFTRYSRVEHNFSSIQMGDSRASVVSKIGKPNYHSGPCGVIHFPSKTCASEYVYSHPFAPLVPEYYIVAFSADDRVVEADTWSSP